MMKKAVENHSKGGGGYIPKAIPSGSISASHKITTKELQSQSIRGMLPGCTMNL